MSHLEVLFNVIIPGFVSFIDSDLCLAEQLLLTGISFS